MVFDHQCITSSHVAPSRKTGKRLRLYVLSHAIGQIKPNEEPGHTGRALRVNLCQESAVQLIPILIVEFILQNAEVLDFLVLDLALVLSSPLPEERIESPGNISTQNWSCLENERLDIVLCCVEGNLALNVLIDNKTRSNLTRDKPDKPQSY